MEITASANARILVNGEDHGSIGSIQLNAESTLINISVRSESGVTVKDYILTVRSSLQGNKLYVRRWDDVLAINHNPANNGGRTITGVRWYRNDEFIGSARYVELEGSIGEYHAEVEIEGEWRRVCPYGGTRAAAMTAYPNPVPRGESLTLQLPDHLIEGKLSIYSISGQLIKSDIDMPTELSSVNVSDLSSGIYLFLVRLNGKSETVKVIIE